MPGAKLGHEKTTRNKVGPGPGGVHLYCEPQKREPGTTLLTK